MLSVPDASGFNSTYVHKEMAAREYEVPCLDNSKKEHSCVISVAILRGCYKLNIQEPGVNEI